MNIKRPILAIVAVFAFVWVTDFLIHHVWLMSEYNATASLWRPANEMGSHFGWLVAAQILWSATFVMLYAKGFADKACLFCAVMFGLFMGLFFESSTLAAYFTEPLPGDLAAKWFVANVAQSVLAGLIAFFVYKPKPCDGKSDCCDAKK
jgi:hypothetical protein